MIRFDFLIRQKFLLNKAYEYKWWLYVKIRVKNRRNIIWDKSLEIYPEYLNKTFYVYNGRVLLPIVIKESMIGGKFGNYVYTKKIAYYRLAKKVKRRFKVKSK